MRKVLGCLIFMIWSCASQQNASHPVLGKVVSSTYQVVNYRADESGFNMQIILRNPKRDVQLDSLNFRGYRAKSLAVEPIGNKLIVKTYIPLVSRKIKGFRKDKTDDSDGLYFSLNGNSYFHTLKFKNTL